MTGSIDRDHAVRNLFDQVVELSPETQLHAIQAADASDDVKQEVLELLNIAGSGRTSAVTRAIRPIGDLLLLAEPPVLLAGDRLGPWEVETLLAEGGMGKVYRAKRADGHFEQTVAIKVMGGIASTSALERLTQERQILAKLTHANIARLLDGGATKMGHPYIVMEYVDGVDIATHCSNIATDVGKILQLFDSVSDAIAFAHRQLVIHCDLKPSNIMATSEGRIVVLDFGIATLLGSSGKTIRGTAYTPEFSSPEQRAGLGLSTATDIYSLGVVLKRLLPAKCSKELLAIANKACSESEVDRYPSVEALKEDLRLFRTNMPLQAIPNTPTYVAKKFAQRRWPWLLAGGLFLTTVSVLGAQVVYERDSAIVAQREAAEQRDAAVASQEAARKAAQVAESERAAAQASEQVARASEQRARHAESVAVANEKKAELARKRAEEEAEVSTAKSSFFTNVFVNKNSITPIVASSSVKDFVNSAKDSFLNSPFSDATLDAKQSIAAMLAWAYENIGERNERLYFTKLQLQTLREMQAKGLGDSSRLAKDLANAYLHLMTMAQDAGNFNEQREWASQYLASAREIKQREWTSERIIGHAYAIQATSAPSDNESVVRDFGELLEAAKSITSENQRRAVISTVYGVLAQIFARSGAWETALKYNQEAISHYPQSLLNVSIRGNLVSLMLERLVYLRFLARIPDALSFYEELDAQLKEKEPQGGILTAMARVSYASVLLGSGNAQEAIVAERDNHSSIVKYFGEHSPRAFDSLLVRLNALLRAGHFSEAADLGNMAISQSPESFKKLSSGLQGRFEAIIGAAEFYKGDRSSGLARVKRTIEGRNLTAANDYSMLMLYIELLLEEGQFSEVAALIDKHELTEIGKADRYVYSTADIHFALGQLSMGKGDLADAARHFESAEADIKRKSGKRSIAAIQSATRRALAQLRVGNRQDAARLHAAMSAELASNGFSQTAGDWRWRKLSQAVAN